MDIVHINEQVADFIEFSPGKPTFNLLKNARNGLAFELHNAWHKIKETLVPIIKEGIIIKSKGIILEISIEIQPLTDIVEPYFLIVFNKTPQQKGNSTGFDDERNTNEDLVIQLEKELAQIHNDVNAIAEEQESSNEELQSANEELLSGSEELQSLNEELETSKEQLLSSNEELIQINQ